MNPPSVNSARFNSPFDHPEQWPLYSVAAIAAEPIVVVAPHPDDETLGCGGAIAALRALGLSVWILVISDGTMSHPQSVAYPPPRLKALRASETRCAMHRLGVNAAQITFLELPDGAVPLPGAADFARASARCRQYLSTIVPSIIFVPWRSDPHPDHRATWHLITRALHESGMLPRVIEYPIWDWDADQRHRDHQRPGMLWRLDISSTAPMKQRAIAAYRSQTTALIDDDPQGFRLTPDMLANFTRPWELYFEKK